MNLHTELFLKRQLFRSYVSVICGSVKCLTTGSKHSLCSPKIPVLDNLEKLFTNHLKSSTCPVNSLNYSYIQTASCSASNEQMDIIFSHVDSILASQDKRVSSLQEARVKELCSYYTSLSQGEKFTFLKKLASDYAVDHVAVAECIKSAKNFNADLNELVGIENKLRNYLTPKYLFVFKTVGCQNGVKFLVDLRENILQLLSKLTAMSPETSPVKQMNIVLQNLISDWFSVGFLELQRITWKSSCEMLQKISEYEAVHPMRSWTDLKRRVGAYRRCFVYTHPAMPDEPLVVLHTALCKDIVSSTSEIFSSPTTLKPLKENGEELEKEEMLEDVNTAIFYSISSTQRGLQGVELGNHLIKRVVRELQSELPQISKFSTISPIPGFTLWLMDRFKQWEASGVINQFPVKELEPFLVQHNGTFWRSLRQLFATNAWYKEPALHAILKEPLMKLCAHYLFSEKKRGYALNSVANFHLQNGAVMWRINWLGDVSPRGLSNSCGIMVNYRYFLSDVEANRENYLKNQVIAASESVRRLTGDATLTSKL